MPSEKELDLSQEDANVGSLKGGEILEEQWVRKEGVNRFAEDGLEEVESGGAPPQNMFTRAFPSEAERTRVFKGGAGEGGGGDGGCLIELKGLCL